MMANRKRVLLGMSGGTDSSVSAAILQEQGFDVTGVTFIFSDLEKQNQDSIDDAQDLARKIGIDHHVVNLREEFQENIIARFIEEYEAGKTPFPCAFCNPKLKFHQLRRLAQEIECQYIATGHYARIININGINFIAKAKDQEKDQSFFLWGLKKEITSKLLFPLGNYQKTEVRAEASKKGFAKLADKKDSLGICFIHGNDYRKFLKSKGIRAEPGNFVDPSGNILGQHQGIINYTVGQRRGLGLNLNTPVFVSEIRPDRNEIVLGEFDELYRKKLFLIDCHFIDIQSVDANKTYIVKVRYRLQETPCKIKIFDDNAAEVELLEPVAMIAKGQTAVFYEGDRVIGGGFISGSD